MTVKFNRTGTELMLEKLKVLKDQKPLSQTSINEIMTNRVVDIWLSAYESWIPTTRADFEKILAFLHTDSPEGLSRWGEHIDMGFRMAIDDLEKMNANLAILSEFNWAQAEWNALKYLPRDTPINVDVFPTIDAFNGGMFRPGKVFLSILYITPTRLTPSNFSHEFHHSGFDHWWKQNKMVQEFLESQDTKEYWTVRLHEYLVSEGLANAFCSPGAISLVKGDSEYINAHNAIITDYEDRWDEFHSLLEHLLDHIVSGNLTGVKEKFEEFTLDISGKGHPIGHFFAGRMIMEMDRSQQVQREQIIDLVKNPFQFFKLYEKAAKERGLKRFSGEYLTRLDLLIDEMIASIS